MSKMAGSSNVIIADIQERRVAFAKEHGFAHRGFTVPLIRGADIEEKLQMSKEMAALAIQTRKTGAVLQSEFDVAIECTGAEACTQAAIYVSQRGPKLSINPEGYRQRVQEARL